MDEQVLPALSGTEKQVAWANDIRARILAEFDGRTLPARYAEQMREGRELLAQEIEARFWIDHQDKGALDLAHRRYLLAHGRASVKNIEGKRVIIPD